MTTVPPMPNQPTYNIDQLARTDLRVSTGPYDPNRLPKFWADPGALESPQATVTYITGYQLDGNNVIQPIRLTLSSAQAAVANIPPVAVAYPPYNPPASTATRAGMVIPAEELSTYIDAVNVAAWFGVAPSEVHEQVFPGFPNIYPAGEMRRTYGFIFNGSFLVVGMLMAAKYVNGVGAPGSWNIIKPGGTDVPGVFWVPGPNGVKDDRTPIAFPLRALTSVEKIIQGPLAQLMVQRTDLQPSPVGPVAPLADSQMLADTHDMLSVLYTLMTGKPFVRG